MGIQIVKGGMLTTVQDLGRFGYQRYGVTVGGAMDPLALRIGNMLLGNEDHEGALECIHLGPTLLFEEKQIIAITGADLSPLINGKPVVMWRPLLVESGSILSFGKPMLGNISYICFCGGLAIQEVLGSRATYLKARFGGLEGRALRKSDYISFRKPLKEVDAAFNWGVYTSVYPNLHSSSIRIIAGPHLTHFEDSSIIKFFSEQFIVNNDSDRMGYRLSSDVLRLKKRYELLSAAVTYGTIQVPSSGFPIVLMADHPTTGGYPVIGQVATVDLALLSQKKVNDRVDFELVTVDEAHFLLKKQIAGLSRLRQSIRIKYE